MAVKVTYFRCISKTRISDVWQSSRHCVKSVLVSIFPYLEWIRRDTEYHFVFIPNAGKSGPEKLWIRTLFKQCLELCQTSKMRVFTTILNGFLSTPLSEIPFHRYWNICDVNFIVSFYFLLFQVFLAVSNSIMPENWQEQFFEISKCFTVNITKILWNWNNFSTWIFFIIKCN